MRVSRYIFFLAAIVLTACTDDSNYEELLDEEKSKISSYLSSHNAQVVSTCPTDAQWPDNLWYKTDKGVYIHLDSTGVDSISITDGSEVILSYTKETLDGELVSDYTKSPIRTYHGYISSSYDYTSQGMYQALTVMKHHLAYARVIIPSKQASSVDMNYVIPYLYTIVLRVPN